MIASVEGETHRALHVEFDGRQFVSACDCGWVSIRFSSSGLANAAWDLHPHDVAEDDQELGSRTSAH